MKNAIALIIFSGLFAGIVSCKKINEATQFSLTFSNSVAVPSASIVVSTTQDFVSDEMETGTADKFNSEGTSADLVDEIVMTEFKLTADTGNLDYLKNISIYIRSSGLNDVLVAQKQNIPAGLTSLKLDVTGNNIKQHLLKEKIQFRATITFNATSTRSHNLKMDQTMLVKAKLIK